MNFKQVTSDERNLLEKNKIELNELINLYRVEEFMHMNSKNEFTHYEFTNQDVEERLDVIKQCKKLLDDEFECLIKIYERK
tara:strand:- start:66 stop:308 length:243 start_codon:yes stop_codon:yes gene_type:complete